MDVGLGGPYSRNFRLTLSAVVRVSRWRPRRPAPISGRNGAAVFLLRPCSGYIVEYGAAGIGIAEMGEHFQKQQGLGGTRIER